MLKPLNENNLRDHLTAFADGELDAAQTAAVWAYLANDPNGPAALRWLADQTQMTLAAKRTITAPAPGDLRDRITSLVFAEPAAGASASINDSHGDGPHPDVLKLPAPTAWPRRIGYAMALAAAVAIGVTIANHSFKAAPVGNVLPVELVAMAGRVHAECSRLPEALHKATFKETDPRLAELTRDDLAGNSNGDVAAPDLSSIGFRFIGAGPCPASRFSTIHLLYRSTKPLGLAAVSLFVQVDAGQFPSLKVDHVYRVSSPTSPFPMLAWRSGKVIYFLLADDERTEAGALQSLHPTAAASIITVAE